MQKLNEVFSETENHHPREAISFLDLEYPIKNRSVFKPQYNEIFFYNNEEEMIRICDDGFYVRGVKVKQNKGEAKKVYRAFKNLLLKGDKQCKS
jgi:hypothetical protein